MTVAQIRALVAQSPLDDRALQALLEQDRRVGVRRLAAQQSRRRQRQEAEKARLERLLELERRLWERGIEWIAGVDEVGRGCLAGPVVAAAVVFPRDVLIPGLDDSKKLRPEKREELLGEIRRLAVAVGMGQVEAEDIDRLNILQASLQAMRLALTDLGLAPGQVLVDGRVKPGSGFPETAVVDGDARSLSIAAASVVAKVHRDRLMVEWARCYPHYGFARHKGYGSEEHLRALQEHGPCPLHRRSFGPVAALIEPEQSRTFLVFKEGLEDCLSRPELERVAHFIKEGTGELNAAELTELRDLYRVRRRQLDDIGRQGEKAAADFLAGQGYEVLERNYRAAGGEIDLIARQENCLVFVEVKSSQAGSLGTPEERVQRAKQAHIARAAQCYLLQCGDEGLDCRFDVIAVSLHAGRPEITHFKDAFQV